MISHTARQSPLEERLRVAGVQPGQRIVSRHQASIVCGLSYKWLEGRARMGNGPPVIKIGSRACYNLDKLLAWFDALEVQS